MNMKKWRWNFDYWTAVLTQQTEPFPYLEERDFYITAGKKCIHCESVHRDNCQISCGVLKYKMTFCETYKNELEEEGLNENNI